MYTYRLFSWYVIISHSFFVYSTFTYFFFFIYICFKVRLSNIPLYIFLVFVMPKPTPLLNYGLFSSRCLIDLECIFM